MYVVLAEGAQNMTRHQIAGTKGKNKGEKKENE